MWLALLLVVVAWASPSGPMARVPVPAGALPVQSDSERQHCRQLLAKRLASTAIVARPTGDYWGPPQSLAAIEAALRLGADGVLLELQRTAEGIWVLAPAPVWLDGEVDIPNLYFEELILHRFVDPVTQTPVGGTVASLREALFLVRENGTLVGLAGEPEQEFADAVREIESADLSGHFLGIRIMPSNLSSPVRDGVDVDLRAATVLASAKPMANWPPRAVFVEDPRAVWSALGRPLPTAKPKPVSQWHLPVMPAPDLKKEVETLGATEDERAYRLAAARLANWDPATLVRKAPQELEKRHAARLACLARALGQVAEHRPDLLTERVRDALFVRLEDADPAAQGDIAVALAKMGVAPSVPVITRLLESGADGAGVARGSAIAVRAKLAYALGRGGRSDPESIRVLEAMVRAHGARLDGGRAAWALGRVRSVGSIAVVRDAALATPEGNRMAALALAMFGTDEALIALETIMNTPTPHSSQIPEKRAREGAWALVRFNVADRTPILAKLLVHGSAAARREGVLGCLQESRPACRTLLELGAPWAVAWWEVEHDSRVREP